MQAILLFILRKVATKVVIEVMEEAVLLLHKRQDQDTGVPEVRLVQGIADYAKATLSK